jgi:hypothetical protein
LFFIGHLWIPEFRTVSKYANFGNIRPIWEWIFPIEIEYFFEKFLLISFRIRIVSNRTTSISVEVYEYCRYLSNRVMHEQRTTATTLAKSQVDKNIRSWSHTLKQTRDAAIYLWHCRWPFLELFRLLNVPAESSFQCFQLTLCRNTQASFDKCMKDSFDMDRPHYGYHSLAKVHQTDR